MSRLLELHDQGRFLVLVSPPRNDPALVLAAFEGGADAAKVHLNVEHRASGTRFGTWAEEEATVRGMLAAGSGPLGIMPGAEVLPGVEDFQAMRQAGLEFFDVYAHHMAPFMWELPMTRMIALGHGAAPAQARELEARGMEILEASVVDPGCYGQPLDEADLEVYRQLRDATSRPILVPSQKALVPGDLARLRGVGVDAVLLGILALGDTAASFRERLPAFVEAAARLGR